MSMVYNNLSATFEEYAMMAEPNIRCLVDKYSELFESDNKTTEENYLFFLCDVMAFGSLLKSVCVEYDVKFNCTLNDCIKYFGDPGRMQCLSDLESVKEISSTIYKMLLSLSSQSKIKLGVVFDESHKPKARKNLKKEYTHKLVFLIWNYIDIYRPQLNDIMASANC